MAMLSNPYQTLVHRINQVLEQGRSKAGRAVNKILVLTYWEIGRYIIEYEQGGHEKAVYGDELIGSLSADLALFKGHGLSRSNLYGMRLFYLRYPIFQTVSGKLSWSVIQEIIGIEDPLERSFYEQQCLRERWSVRELRRQKKSMLFHRLAASRDKDGILKLAASGQEIQYPQDLLREPYVLEFLSIPEPFHLHEIELERRLIENLQQFLLELGKGFAFIGRQYRINIGTHHHYVDLVFYHRILKCFVLIDLKSHKADHSDIGQMNMYLNYFEEEENTEDDNPPIGIVFAREKNDMVVRYATKNIGTQLFVGKYQLYLPKREELQQKLEEIFNTPDPQLP